EMTFKTIMVHAEDSGPGRSLLEEATAFARANGAHLVALVCGIEPPAPYVGISPGPIDGYIADLERARTDTRAEVKRIDAFLTRLGGAFEVRGATVQSGLAGAEFTRHARYADLAIFPQSNTSGTLHRLLDTTLLESGKPVLVLPEGAHLKTIGRRVAIAWDAGAEAARAVHYALPLMVGAEDVRVVMVDPHTGLSYHGEEPGADLGTMLARHGLPVSVDALPDEDQRFATIFLRHANDMDADLLVAGAYGHWRMAQVILGGATRDLMRDAKRPLLMAH
ncbi:MAG: universal stress protein, partial [Pseudomonadota bacterium]